MSKSLVKKNNMTPREKVHLLGKMIDRFPNSSHANAKSEIGLGCWYVHDFTDGLYIRKMFIPKDLMIVTKVHKTQHPYFIMQGDVTVYLDGESVRLKAPYSGITQPGTQRAMLTHSDTVWITVHVTESQDVEEIAKEVVADSFDEIQHLLEDDGQGGVICHSQQ